MSLYEVLGREQGIQAAVEEFYRRVVADPALAHHFAGTDLDQLRRHQTALLVHVTGGPSRYTGRTLTLAHQRLGITDADFDRVVQHLGATLNDLGVDQATVGEVAGALAVHREEIVARPAVGEPAAARS